MTKRTTEAGFRTNAVWWCGCRTLDEWGAEAVRYETFHQLASDGVRYARMDHFSSQWMWFFMAQQGESIPQPTKSGCASAGQTR